jgi:hypothetical protein
LISQNDKRQRQRRSQQSQTSPNLSIPFTDPADVLEGVVDQGDGFVFGAGGLGRLEAVGSGWKRRRSCRCSGGRCEPSKVKSNRVGPVGQPCCVDGRWFQRSFGCWDWKNQELLTDPGWTPDAWIPDAKGCGDWCASG